MFAIAINSQCKYRTLWLHFASTVCYKEWLRVDIRAGKWLSLGVDIREQAQLCAKICEGVYLLCCIHLSLKLGWTKLFSVRFLILPTLTTYTNSIPFWKRVNLWRWSWQVTQRTNTPTTLLLLWPL